MARILIVEDDALIRRLYEQAFNADGYEVVTAANGEQGLSAVKSGAPTLILLDIMMPKVNGLELLEKIKADPKYQKIPVIMLTNMSGQEDAKTALKMGAVKYIVKGEHKPKEIVDMVKEILSGYIHNVPKTASKPDAKN